MTTNAYLDDFMARFRFEGLTYDDVSLITQYADFLPDSASTATRLTSRITMNTPFLSAAMDTVTESEMAIAMAKLGGIGVIHKNLSVDHQCDQVNRVKHHLNGLIHAPVTFHVGQTVADVEAYRAENNIEFSGFPILDQNERIVGLLSKKDVAFCPDHSVKVEEAMVRDFITAPAGTDVETAYKMMLKAKKGKLPLLDSDGHLAGLYSFTDVRDLMENRMPMANRDSRSQLRVAAAVSGGSHDYERVERLAAENIDVIVVDSAHGHTKGIMDMVKWISSHYPDIDIIAGNVVTAEGAIALRDCGAHAVKVGIGPGSICTTRVICGVGVPQITAVYTCAKALEGSIPVIADGGIRYSGDVPKALVAGAETVMLGSILAATEESPGEKIWKDGRKYVLYRGMGSLAAMQANAGSRSRYGQSHRKSSDLVPEGIEGMVPYTGTVSQVMTQFCGGLRSSLGYNGARSIQELREKGKFVRVSLAGLQEAHPHNITLTREAPNYHQ